MDETVSSSSLLDGAARERIARLLGSGSVTFSYCLPTQLLGKLTDRGLDALCLQRGDDEDSDSQWDPRSFAARVIVPWVRENENVLGKSPDPYVSNPLRQARIPPSPPNVRQHTLALWADLHTVLSDVQERDDPEYTLAVFIETLLRIYADLRHQDFRYPVLPRVSLEQTLALVRQLVEASREGEHTMSIMAAVLTVVGRRFDSWERVVRRTSTTSDQASGLVGDLECRKGDRLVFAAEVKERPVGIADVRTFEDKLNDAGVTEALLNAPSQIPDDETAIRERTRLMWTRGVNLYHLPVADLVSVTMSLAGEQTRTDLIAEIGLQLDEFARPASRLVWRDLLNRVLDGSLPD